LSDQKAQNEPDRIPILSVRGPGHHSSFCKLLLEISSER
jgi:hypothetical protein